MTDAKEHGAIPIEMCEILEAVSHESRLPNIRRWQTDVLPSGTTPATFRKQIEWLVRNGYLGRPGGDLVVLTERGRAVLPC